jgi:hypothetical protein
VRQFTEWLRQQEIPPNVFDLVVSRATTDLVNLGGATPRMSAPLLEIEPSTSLGDPLEFDPERSRQNIEHGYIDTLRVLRDSSQMTDSRPPLSDREYRHLMDQPILAEVVHQAKEGRGSAGGTAFMKKPVQPGERRSVGTACFAQQLNLIYMKRQNLGVKEAAVGTRQQSSIKRPFELTKL